MDESTMSDYKSYTPFHSRKHALIHIHTHTHTHLTHLHKHTQTYNSVAVANVTSLVITNSKIKLIQQANGLSLSKFSIYCLYI